MPWNDRFGVESLPPPHLLRGGGRDRSLLREAAVHRPRDRDPLAGEDTRRHFPIIKPFVGMNGEHIKAVVNTRAPPPKLAKKMRPRKSNLPGHQPTHPHPRVAARRAMDGGVGNSALVSDDEDIDDDYEPYRRAIERLRQQQGGVNSEGDLAIGVREIPVSEKLPQRSSVSQHQHGASRVSAEVRSSTAVQNGPDLLGGGYRPRHDSESAFYDGKIGATPASNSLTELTLDVEKLPDRRSRSRVAVDTLKDPEEAGGSLSPEESLSLEDSAAINDLRMFVASQPGTSSGAKKNGGYIESFPLCRLNVIGRGSSSVVYRSIILPELGIVAEKVITVAEKEKRHQLVRELRHLRSLLLEGGALCPAVVQLISVVPHPRDGTVSVCLELMDGGSLQDVVKAGGCRDEAVLSRIAFQVLCGLDFLHGRRQVHRDIKPGNILVNMSGRVTISDFGISKELQSGQSLADTFVGTYNYMSPERISGQPYSFSSDIWSFGLVVLACALGRYPYATELGYWALLNAIQQQPAPVLPTSPPIAGGSGGVFSQPLSDLVAAALNKDVSTRPSAAELLRHGAFEPIRRASELVIEPHDDLPYEIDDETIINWDICRSPRVLRPIETWLLQNPLQPAQVLVTKPPRVLQRKHPHDGGGKVSGPNGKSNKSLLADVFSLTNLPFPLSIPFVKELGLAFRQQLAGSAHPPPPSWAPNSAAAWLDLHPFGLAVDAASVSALATRLQVEPELLQEVFISALKFARGGEGAVLELKRAAVVPVATSHEPSLDALSPTCTASPDSANKKAGANVSHIKGMRPMDGPHSEFTAAFTSNLTKNSSAPGILKPRGASREEGEEGVDGARGGNASPPHQTSKKPSPGARGSGAPRAGVGAKKVDPKRGMGNAGMTSLRGGDRKSKPKAVAIDIGGPGDDDIFVVFPKRNVVKTPRAADGNKKAMSTCAPAEEDDDYADDDFVEEEEDVGGGGEDDAVPEDEAMLPAPLARMQAGAQVLDADDLTAAGLHHYKSPPKPPHYLARDEEVAHSDDTAGDVYIGEDDAVANSSDDLHIFGDMGEEKIQIIEQEEEERFPPGMMLDDLAFIDETLTFTQEGRGGENLFSPPPGLSSLALAMSSPSSAAAAARTATGIGTCGSVDVPRPGRPYDGKKKEEEEEEYEWDLDDEPGSTGHSPLVRGPWSREGGGQHAGTDEDRGGAGDADADDDYNYGADDDFLHEDNVDDEDGFGGRGDYRPADAETDTYVCKAIRGYDEEDADLQHDSFEEEEGQADGPHREAASRSQAARTEGEGKKEASGSPRGSVDYEDDPYGDDDFFG